MTINRFCSSGLQAIAIAAGGIMSGGAETVIAGGTESMSMIPMGGQDLAESLANGQLSRCVFIHGPHRRGTGGVDSESRARRRMSSPCGAIGKRWRRLAGG